MPRRPKRRAAGEGTLTKLGDGRWQYRFPFEGRRVGVTARTQEEVLAKARAKRRELEARSPVADPRRTVEDWLNQWLVEWSKPKVRHSTWFRHEGIVRNHLIPVLGRHRLADLHPNHVNRAQADWQAAGLSPASIAQHRAVLRRALNVAMRLDLVTRNAAALADPPKIVTREVPPVGPREAQAILRAIEGDGLEALHALALLRGLRQGEALGLRWDDLDLDGQLLHVRRTLTRIEGRWTFQEPKTKRSRRVVPLSPQLAALLRAHRARQAIYRLKAGDRWGVATESGRRPEDWNLVFTTESGGPLSPATVTHGFQRLLKDAGLAPMRWHDLRHAAATLMLSQGASPRTVMETLGHSQISTAMNIYAGVLPEMQREAADRVDAAVWGEASG